MKGGDQIGRLTLTGNWERPLTLTLSPGGRGNSFGIASLDPVAGSAVRPGTGKKSLWRGKGNRAWQHASY